MKKRQFSRTLSIFTPLQPEALSFTPLKKTSNGARRRVVTGFAITLIAIFMLFLAPQPADAAFGPFNPLPKQIVPECNVTVRNTDGQITGLDPKKICTFCDFLELIQNLLNYVWWVITPVLIVIALIWGGALMFISSAQGNVTQAQRGKKIIFNTLIGFVLVFGAWLIIDTVIKILGGRIGSNTAVSPFGPWNKIRCDAPVVSTTPPPLPPPSPSPSPSPSPTPGPGGGGPTETERNLAKIVRDQGHCGGTASCGSVGSCATLSAVASGNPPPVCSSGCTASSGCTPKPNVHLSTSMLMALDSLHLSGSKFIISSITTGSHSPASRHYQGKAVDLIKQSPTTYSQLEGDLNSRGAIFVQCEKSAVKVSCNSGSIDHIHAEFQ